jgi:hypothetical protein
MPRQKKPEFEFSHEERAVLRAMPKLTLCPKYTRRKVGSNGDGLGTAGFESLKITSGGVL